MKAPTLVKSVLAGAVFVGALTTQPLLANVELVVDGANSTLTLLYIQFRPHFGEPIRLRH